MAQDTSIFNRNKSSWIDMPSNPFPIGITCSYLEGSTPNNFSFIKPWREKPNNFTYDKSLQNPSNFPNMNSPYHFQDGLISKDQPQIAPSNITYSDSSGVTSPEVDSYRYGSKLPINNSQQIIINRFPVSNLSQQNSNEYIDRNPPDEKLNSYHSQLIQNPENDENDNYSDSNDDDPMDELNETADQFFSSISNSNMQLNTNQKKKHLGRSPKRNVSFSRRERNFKDLFYLILKPEKKKFRKELIREVHNYMRKFIDFPPITREQTRRIDLYFIEYAKYDMLILSFLKSHKIPILQQIAGLAE